MRLKDISSKGKYRVIMSGGGTGGHFYPAVAIAEALKARYGDDVDIFFVGAYGKMEMEKVPLLGWPIIGLNIMGLQRRLTLKNLMLPFKVIGSYIKARSIIKRFKPHVVVGTGGYVTLPIVDTAAKMGVKTVIWEGNSYPGMANRRLAKRATSIMVPHSGLIRFFDEKRVVVSGTPLRGRMNVSSAARESGYTHFSLIKDKPTLFVTGGSLGTMVFNRAIINRFEELRNAGVNLIWQCGSRHHDEVIRLLEGNIPDNFYIAPFIDKMELAYNVADVVISRAGASSLAELALMGSAAIIVPSSLVPDNHQEKNALTYVEAGAALMVVDGEVEERLIPLALNLLANDEERGKLRKNIKGFAEPKAAEKIVDSITTILE